MFKSNVRKMNLVYEKRKNTLFYYIKKKMYKKNYIYIF